MDVNQPDFKPVFIMGAGATHALGAPLLADFLQRSKDIRFSSSFPESLKGPFDRAFKYQSDLSTTKNFMAVDLDNLEVLFSMVDMAHQTTSIDTKEKARFDELTNLRNDFMAVVIETLHRSIRHRGDNWEFYRSVVRRFAAFPTASFITFNYDLAIERALETAGSFVVRYGLTEEDVPTDSKERFVLKLHGSADWGYCRRCKNVGVLKKYVAPMDLPGSESIIHHSSKCSETADFINILIPPTWQKLNYVDQITRVWHYSIKEISFATHLFVIGYSFPRTDVFFDQLLAHGLSKSSNLKKLVVVNPSDQIERLINVLFEPHFFRKNVIFVKERFEDLISWVTINMDSEKDMQHLMKRFEEKFRRTSA